MNKSYLINKDTLTTIAQGALGAMTFGAYHQFTTNKMMDMNNELQNIKNNEKLELIKREQHKEIEDIKQEHHKEIVCIKQEYNQLLEKINNLEKKSWW